MQHLLGLLMSGQVYVRVFFKYVKYDCFQKYTLAWCLFQHVNTQAVILKTDLHIPYKTISKMLVSVMIKILYLI